MTKSLILASSSKARAQLLSKFRHDYITHTPDIDESIHKNEAPHHLVQRLSLQKAQAVAKINTHQGYIIASDQVGVFNSEIITKPSSKQQAFDQLKKFSNTHVKFITSLCILCTCNDKKFLDYEEFHVYFRQLSDREIRCYIEKENTLDSAGSFKAEGLGVSLFERFEGRDFNTLIGLPVLMLNKALIERFNYNILSQRP